MILGWFRVFMAWTFRKGLLMTLNVLGQLYLGKASLANGVQELVAPNVGLLVSRDGCKVM